MIESTNRKVGDAQNGGVIDRHLPRNYSDLLAKVASLPRSTDGKVARD